MTDPLWRPEPGAAARGNLGRLAAALSQASGREFADYASVHRYSVEEPGRFWSLAWDVHGVRGDKGPAPHLEAGDRMPGARFFPGARLNYAENLLVRNDDTVAIVFQGEDKVARRMSWSDLNREAAAFQEAFRAAGVMPGDRVAAILPNMPEGVAALLGAAASGAIWSSCSPDFGAPGVLDRFGQIEPTVLVAVDGYHYNGRVIRIADKLKEIVDSLPSLKRVLIVSYLGEADDVAAAVPKAEAWRGFDPASPHRRPLFLKLPFDHPLYILFSSGTTGIPKCIVHSAGGTLLKHLSEQRINCELKPGDRLFYFTTLGWMMWNWLVSGLASGATLVLYDGSPFYPSGNVLFDLADREGVTHLGTSAKFIDALRKSGLRPIDTHRLDTVRMILSTGSPLVPEGFAFVYDAIRRDVHLASISGGTDICGCFVLGVPDRAVYAGEIQGPGLGMAVDVVDEDGHHLAAGKGELVCTRPFPSMPIAFWNDPDGQKYHNAYFARFPNIWHHGDFAEWTAHGGVIIHGRSDATLNPGGVRIGTAEIYRQVESLPEIQESIVVGQDVGGDVRVVLFVVMRPGHVLDEALVDRIKARIRAGTTPRHVPARILAVADIPRTKSGKITELAVRDVIHGRTVKNKEALANPEALDLFRDLPELKV
ncbi:MAG: acetoacetate--CoA ligase [Hyphomicrobiaceae bacterium]